LAAVLVIAALLTLFLFLVPTSDTLRLPWAFALSTDSPFHLDESNLSAALGRYPVLALDCYYPGCGPCKTMNQTVEELSRELRGQVAFALINAQSNRNFTNLYHASNYPTVFLFKDGDLSARLTGNRSKADVLAELRKLKPDLDTSRVKGFTGANATAPIVAATQEISLTSLGTKSPDKPMPVEDGNLQNALKSYPLMVVDAYVRWCEPCHRMNQTVTELSRELRGQVAFGVLDVAENPVTKAAYNITSYPTFLIFDEGKLVSILIGTRSPASLLQELKGIHPTLDTSNVKISSAAAPAAKPAAPPQQLPMARLGVENPDKLMMIDEDSLQQALDKYPFFVLEGFADWCDHCHTMNATLSQLAGELQGQAAFGLMNVQDNLKAKAEYNITSYPTLFIFKDGMLKDRIIGNQQKSVFVARLKKVNPVLDTSKVKISQPAVQAPTPAKAKLSPAQICANMTKSDHPVLEAFVVSRCPFGLQMQRIMADIISHTPEARDFMRVAYIGSITNGTIESMHGSEEAAENARQICIRDEQPGRYWDYVSCYMKDGKSEECLGVASVDQSKLASCLKDPKRGLAYAGKDFALADANKITGSPTLVMNGKIVKESDFATNTTNSRSSEAVKELLCCGFNRQPSFCSLALNTTRAATMFSVKAQPAAPAEPAKAPAPAAQVQPAQVPLAKLEEAKPEQLMLINDSQPMLVNDSTISSAIRQYPLLVVEVYATWCGYSRMMNATLAELAGELQGQVAFALIDGGKNKQTKTDYNISAAPTLLIFKDGKLVDTVLGNQQKSGFVAMLKKIDPALDTSKVKVSPPPDEAPPEPTLTPEQICSNMSKSDRPVLQAFIVSRCPFGLQMQRILAEMVGNVPEAEESLKVMYIGSVKNGTLTSMHGDKEAQENARQICIREEQPDRYWDYMGCFMKNGSSEKCLVSVDQDKLASCLADPKRGLAYAQKDFDLADKYEITGSPTLVMNGQIVDEFDFATDTISGRSQEALKELLCCGFRTKPGYCSRELSGTEAATMFSAS
jgi:thioredoxin 1